MSWAKDEWKQELPSKALQKINDMENEYENLQKLRQQQDLKIDGYVTALEKGKIDLEEERSSSAALQKEVQELTLKVSNLEAKEERYASEIKNKEKAVEYGEELLEKSRQKLKMENAKVLELEKSLEQQSKEAEKYGEMSDKMAVEIGNLKQEKAHISKENDNYKERLGALTKELLTLRQIISENEQKSMEVAQENEKDNDESCHQEPVAMGHHRSDAFLDILKKENASLLRDVEQLRLQREQMKNIIDEKTNEIERSATKVADLRSELQDTRRELKTSKVKISKLEGSAETREREIANLRDKVAKYKANEERMKEEIQTLIWKDQLNQHDDLLEQSKHPETVGVEKGPSDSLGDAEGSKATVTDHEDKLCQLSKENETLHEQIRYLREVNSALVENVKDKDDRLRLYYDEKQEQIKREEARLERVEVLLLENGRLKERIQELENEAKTSSANVQVCARCKEKIMANEKPSQVNPDVDKEKTPEEEDMETVTDTDVCTKTKDADGTLNVAMAGSMGVDESVQVKDKSTETAAGVTDMEQMTHLEHLQSSSNKDAEEEEEKDYDDDDNNDDNAADDDSNDVISCTTAEHNSLQHKILQVLLSLSTVQVEHEMVQRGVNKCYNTVKRLQQVLSMDIRVSDTENRDSMSKLYSHFECLTRQLKAVKGIGQRYAASVKSQIESINGYLEEVKESNTEAQDGQKDRRSPGRRLSWDDFESERAFQVFKATVDPLIKQIENEGEEVFAKECESLQTTSNKPKDLRQGSQIDDQVNVDRFDSGPECNVGKTDGTENALQLDDFADVLRTLMDENNDLLTERMESLLQRFESNMMKNIAQKKQGQQDERKFPSSAQRSGNKEDIAVANPSEEEILIFEELELTKRKISGVQKLVKQLMSSIETTKQEKEEADSHIDLLTNQMRNISSHHEIRYTELERTLRTASERELTLQRQINDLQTEKEGISCNYKESFENLRQKEQELAKLSQEIKNIQANTKENEHKLKNKIEVLQGEKTCIWHDYMEASKEAQERKIEIESLVAKMKKTEVSLMSLFNTIGNIDDFLQRAKEMNLFQ